MSDRLFFVHIMKTGGTSLLFNLIEHFGPGEVYPDPAVDTDKMTAYSDVAYMLNVPERRSRLFRAYSGHFPYVAVKLLPGPFVTLTVLRDPVDRTISYLKQCRGLEQFHEYSLEQIYDDQWQFLLAMHNYQARIFSITADDVPLSVMNAIAVDDGRLALAKANLAEIDELGLLEHYDEFAARVSARFGWPSTPWTQRRVGGSGDASETLRRRIVSDNAADIEFYEYARDLYADRRSV